MSNLQVRNLPDDIHSRLSERARRLDMSMSEYVTRVLRADLDRPLFEDWATAARRAGTPRPIDTLAAIDATRDEYDPRPPAP
ncbi:MAG: hypothetical protein QM728_04695 [Gordonia sp. (in: high G+C Gram-positive bacteria)]|uniref:FitA-like ribbon-helix-helix domain-containing protein n=1 Tax=Gordonia sp. (in: high G+C Gram-positive bacteria) TaxID=84139 RepID=UPI0039E66DA5